MKKTTVIFFTVVFTFLVLVSPAEQFVSSGLDRPADPQLKQTDSKGSLFWAGFRVCWQAHWDIFAAALL